MSHLRCLNCRVNMVRVDSPAHGYRLCPQCRSAFVSIATLRKLVRVSELSALWKSTPHLREARRCPHCDLKMDVVSSPSRIALEVDLCRICAAFWFDPTELHKLPRPLAVRPPSSLPTTLHEARHAMGRAIAAHVA